MNIVAITLVKSLRKLISQYNDKVPGINFVDVRNFENYIREQGFDIPAVNKFIENESPNLKMISIFKDFQKEVSENLYGVNFKTYGVDGFLEQLEDDIYEMEGELEEEEEN